MTTRAPCLARRVLGLTALALLAAQGAPAWANGRSSAVNGLALHPNDPTQIVAQATFGLLYSRDSGEHFHWICESSVGFSGTYDPRVAFTADGALLATVSNGLTRSSDGGCSFTPATGLPDDLLSVHDVAAHPSDPTSVLLATESVSRQGAVYRSTDGGLSFAQAAMAMPDLPAVGVLFSQAKPGRAVALFSGASQSVLAVSDDGGATFQTLPAISEGGLSLVGLGKAKPDAAYLGQRVDETQANGDPGAGFLLEADLTGQADLRQLVQLPGGVTGFAETPGTLMVTSLHAWMRSKDGGQSWEPAPTTVTGEIRCLGAAADEAYLCIQNTVADLPNFARTVDGSEIQGIYTYRQTCGPSSECPADSPTRAVCGTLWEGNQKTALGATQCEEPTGPGPDAGVSDGAASDRNGDSGGSPGGCSLPAPSRSGSPALTGLALLALSMLCLGRRRRR